MSTYKRDRLDDPNIRFRALRAHGLALSGARFRTVEMQLGSIPDISIAGMAQMDAYLAQNGTMASRLLLLNARLASSGLVAAPVANDNAGVDVEMRGEFVFG